jgi:histidinol-phosphate aminotransferase
MAELNKVKDSYNLSRLNLVAAAAALDDYEWMQRNVTRICGTRARLIEGLRALGFHVVDSQANFVLARRRGRDLGSLQFALKNRGILVRHFDTPELRGALRVTVGTDPEVETLLEVLRPLIATWGSEGPSLG